MSEPSGDVLFDLEKKEIRALVRHLQLEASNMPIVIVLQMIVLHLQVVDIDVFGMWELDMMI